MKAEHDLGIYIGNMGANFLSPTTRNEVFPQSPRTWWAPMRGLWNSTNGASGEKPPEEIDRLMEYLPRIKAEASLEKRNALLGEVFEIHEENFWYFSVYRLPPAVYQLSNRIGNVDREEGVVCPSCFNFAQIYIVE